MRNAIILHGQPSKEEYYDPATLSPSNAHWLPWLQSQLLKNDIAAITPEIPFAYEPGWELWKNEVERYDIGPETIIVGHSRGGDFWLRWLSENRDKKVGKVVLVAPSVGYLTDDDNYFGYYEIDSELADRTQGVYLFASDNDSQQMIESADEIKEKMNDVTYREFHYGHFTLSGIGKPEFPELLDELLQS
jgi:predicted alpha/beta hydrolase family esterase